MYSQKHFVYQHVTLRKEHPYQSNCTTNWTETNLNLSKMVDMKPQYSIAVSFLLHCAYTFIVPLYQIKFRFAKETVCNKR